MDAVNNEGSYGSLENTNFTGTYIDNELHISNSNPDLSVELLGYLYGNVFNGTAIGRVALQRYEFEWYTQKD